MPLFTVKSLLPAFFGARLARCWGTRWPCR